MKFEPLGDRVLVKPIEEKETIKSGIIIPQTVKEKPVEGEVIAIGQGYNKDGMAIAMHVKVGDHILYARFAGTEIKLEEEKFLILYQDDILGRIEKTEEVKNG